MDNREVDNLNVDSVEVLTTPEQLRAEISIVDKGMGLVAPGQQAKLFYDAFPYQRFGVGGVTITEISDAPVAPADQPAGVAWPESKEALYRIVAKLDRQSVAAYGRAGDAFTYYENEWKDIRDEASTDNPSDLTGNSRFGNP